MQIRDYEKRVTKWLFACFGVKIMGDKVERNYRFLEEALELVQACGCTKDEALSLVDYVYGRPLGDPPQEVGGVIVTLAAHCQAHGIDLEQAAVTELDRIEQPEIMAKIRLKQVSKPNRGPLPC